jgi:hypothetical protein
VVKAEASITIARGIEAVYQFVAEDFERNYPRWSPEVKQLRMASQGPLRVGTTGHQIRVDQGRKTESTFKIVQMKPGERLSFQGIDVAYFVDYRFEPTSHDHTRLTFTFELRRLELMMRPFEKLIRLSVQDGAQRTVRNLKRLIEREPAPERRVA